LIGECNKNVFGATVLHLAGNPHGYRAVKAWSNNHAGLSDCDAAKGATHDPTCSLCNS